jgi:phytoene dehydrogenase-like protein
LPAAGQNQLARFRAKSPVFFPTCFQLADLLNGSAEAQNERANVHALERSYDGIIIGAGHHGLVLGAYLAKTGLHILIVERRLDYGGGLCTKEATEPGFYHNLHSINHFHISETPWFKDLHLSERVTYITPRYEFGQAHSDGTALVLGRDLEETVANIARFSKRDAATFREWNRKAEGITAQIFLPERYSEPLPQTEREALLSRTLLGREFLAVTKRQPLEVVQELFDNEHVRLLFLFKISLFGTWLVDTLSKTSPMGSVIRAFDLESGYQLCQGGSFNLARGLMEIFIAAGGRYQPEVAIDRIVIEGGRASGIALVDGRTVRAKFIASTLDVHQMFDKLVGREQLPAPFRCKLDQFQYTTWALFGLHLALHESPHFTAASFDPNIDRALKWSIGAETMEDLFTAHREVQAGRVPKVVQFGSGPLSVLDPTQAPPGKHTTYAWHVMPLTPDLGGQDDQAFHEEFADKIIETWARYCPNMTSKNIIARYIYTARDYARELINMRNGDIFMGAFNAEQVMYNHFGYRTPIANLYNAGSAGHPGGAISGGSGYITAGIIARDLGLKLWWRPWDARTALNAMPQAA